MDECVPKVNGFDIEVCNLVDGLELPGGTGREASLALQRQFEGVSSSAWSSWQTNARSSFWSAQTASYGGWYSGGAYPDGETDPYDDQSDAPYAESTVPATQSTDWGRKWPASNGSCAYIDLNHLELCGGEVLGAVNHVAMWQAMLLKSREARVLANAKLPAGQSVEVFANNSDGLGNSYGGHIDLLITRSCFENVLHRKMHHLSFLAAHQASSGTVLCGQGKVGSENGHEHVNYQLSQRADFVEVLAAVQTTYNRPLINLRSESLCGLWNGQTDESPELARLHVISYDTNLCHMATFLKVGTLQLVLCMLEQEVIVPELMLDDPVDAIANWSHGDLQATSRLASGAFYTATDVQEAILEKAAAFVADGRADNLVPDAELIIKHWSETVSLLRQNDIHSLARRCDWALKLIALDRAMAKHQKSWVDPEIKALDVMYSNIDPNRGLYWQYEAGGFTEQMVSAADIERAAAEPPETTRAWTRAQLLHRADPSEIEAINWDSIRIRPRNSSVAWTLHLNNPLKATKAENEAAFQNASSLTELLERLGAEQEKPSTSYGQYAYGTMHCPGSKSTGPKKPILLPAYTTAPAQPHYTQTDSDDPNREAGQIQQGGNDVWDSTENEQ